MVLCRVGHFLTMLSDGQLHVLNVGDSVFLECSFRADHYSIFDYPVIWRKQQHDELVQMNVMGSLNEPFVSSNRFEVTLNSMAPRHLVELTILGRSGFRFMTAIPIYIVYCIVFIYFYSMNLSEVLPTTAIDTVS